MIEARLREYGFVYGIRSLDLIKIGVANDIEKRMNVMRLHNPHGIELVFYRKVYAPYVFERRMHELLVDKAVGREWFKVSLAELRRAAARAKSRSVSELKKTERWQASPSEIVTPVTHQDINSNGIKELHQ